MSSYNYMKGQFLEAILVSASHDTIEIERSATAPSTLLPIIDVPTAAIDIAAEGTIVDTCRRCSRPFGINNVRRSNASRDFCVECAKLERQEASEAKKNNKGWLEAAFEQGIPLWEQQPDESVEEYELWQAYSSLWPEVRPTVSRVAEQLDFSVAYVQKVFNKWSWPTRMQSWIREVSADRTAELRAAKRIMVEDHIRLGEALRSKMITAVENLDPEDVTPGELVQLLKETQRLEQTGRDALDDIEKATADDVDTMPQGLFEDESSAADKSNARGLSVEDMAEVVGILSAAGLVTGGKVGVRQTTEVVAVTDEL